MADSAKTQDPRSCPSGRSGRAAPAVVLLSGGMDSAVTLAMARRDGYRCFALSFDYGQRHRYELRAAKRVAEAIGAERHVTLGLDLRAFGGSALTSDIPVPKDRLRDDTPRGRRTKAEIPVTYVPARNAIFLACALGFAESVGARELFIGANAVDYSGYPDCRPAFIRAFERMANLATRDGADDAEAGRGAHFRVHAPLMRMGKAEIVRAGVDHDVDFALTHTCYDPGPRGKACEHCDACVLRAAGFAQAGLRDPVR